MGSLSAETERVVGQGHTRGCWKDRQEMRSCGPEAGLRVLEPELRR